MLWVYDHNKYFNSYSAGIDFSCYIMVAVQTSGVRKKSKYYGSAKQNDKAALIRGRIQGPKIEVAPSGGWSGKS